MLKPKDLENYASDTNNSEKQPRNSDCDTLYPQEKF